MLTKNLKMPKRKQSSDNLIDIVKSTKYVNCEKLKDKEVDELKARFDSLGIKFVEDKTELRAYYCTSEGQVSGVLAASEHLLTFLPALDAPENKRFRAKCTDDTMSEFHVHIEVDDITKVGVVRAPSKIEVEGKSLDEHKDTMYDHFI